MRMIKNIAFLALSMLCMAILHTQQSVHAASYLAVDDTFDEDVRFGRDDFVEAITLVIKQMASSYAAREDDPITIEVLDLDSPGMRQFVNAVLRADAGGYDMHSLMILHYEHQAKVNGKNRSTCLLMYNRHKKKETLAAYESYFHSKVDILYYLAAHEFAHCMAMHQSGLGKMLGARDDRAHELLADKVAIAFFLSNGNTRGAQRIVDFNKYMINPTSEHYHPKDLETFLTKAPTLLTRQSRGNISMLDLFIAASAP